MAHEAAVGASDPINTSNWTVTAGASGATTTTDCFTYWQTGTSYPLSWSLNNYPIYYPLYIDKGKQAYEVVKKLVEVKLLALKTAKQFMDAMDAVLKAL